MPQFHQDSIVGPSQASWKNSIRHNLSLHKCFQKQQNENAGESSWWIYVPEGGPRVKKYIGNNSYYPQTENNNAQGTQRPRQKQRSHQNQNMEQIEQERQTASAQSLSGYRVAPNMIYKAEHCQPSIDKMVNKDRGIFISILCW